MTIPAEPFYFRPRFEEKIWGGERLGTLFGKSFAPGTTVGESWELSAVKNAGTVVASGNHAGQSLETLYSIAPEALVGPAAAQNHEFPLLVKFIDAHDRLSVQVHPDDVFARERFGEPFGKTECWYIADAGTSGALAVGFKKSVSRKELRDAVESGEVEQLLNIVEVKTGEVYFIPARTVHAILNDVVIYEVQQNSNTTLRLYDWKRTDAAGNPRPLHIEDAVAVADLGARESYRIEPLALPSKGYHHSVRVACEYFALEEYSTETAGAIALERRSSCGILTFLEGPARLEWSGGGSAVCKGDTVLLPAAMGAAAVTATAGCRFLLTTIPALQTEIIKPLEEARFTSVQIAQLCGIRHETPPGDR